MNRKNNDQQVMRSFLRLVLGVAVLVCTMPGFVSGQYFGGWPGGFSGLYMGGPFFGSYGTGLSSFSTLSSYPYSGTSIGFSPLWGGNSTGLFGLQAGSSYSQGLFGGFTQSSVPSGVSAWGGSLFGGTWQPVSSLGFSGGYTGGLQSGSTWRGSLGSQNSVRSFSPSWPVSSYNTTGIYQSPISWAPVYTTPVSSGSTSASEIAEMPPVSGSQEDDGYVPDQILVKFREGTSKEKQKDIHDRHGCKEISTSAYSGCTVVEIPSYATVEEMVNQYIQEAEVEFAEPNYIRHRHLVPNDPYFPYQWHHSTMKSTLAWDLGRGAGVIVAVLDSGVAYRTGGVYTQAPDLAGTAFKVGWDFVNSDPYPDDDNGHGTHMAGCIAQTTNNLRGVAGVAYGATIFPVKIMDQSGDVTIANEADGIYYAVNNGAHIINLSLGGVGTSATEEAAVTYAVNSGVAVICSAGNSGSSTLEYPASYPPSISVSAVRYDRTLASYSNYGTAIDVCAPGGDINADQNYDGYGDGILQQTHTGTNVNLFYYYFMEGTSPAAALVSGVAALIVGKSTVSLSSQQITSILTSSATDLGVAGWDQRYGWGLVNAYNALLKTT